MPPMCMGTQLQVRDMGEDSYPIEIKYYKTYYKKYYKTALTF